MKYIIHTHHMLFNLLPTSFLYNCYHISGSSDIFIYLSHLYICHHVGFTYIYVINDEPKPQFLLVIENCYRNGAHDDYGQRIFSESERLDVNCSYFVAVRGYKRLEHFFTVERCLYMDKLTSFVFV